MVLELEMPASFSLPLETLTARSPTTKYSAYFSTQFSFMKILFCFKRYSEHLFLSRKKVSRDIYAYRNINNPINTQALITYLHSPQNTHTRTHKYM